MLSLINYKKMHTFFVGFILLFTSLILSGCGAGTDLEVSIPGMGLLKVGGEKKDPKLADRGPLVIPPNTKKLPNPEAAGTQQAQNEQQLWPDDPDERKKKIAELKKKEKKKEDEDPFNPEPKGEGLFDKIGKIIQ